MPLSTLQETSHDVPCKTRGQDGFATSLPVGLLHPLQHAGLARRTPGCPSSVQNRCRVRRSLPTSRLERSRPRGGRYAGDEGALVVCRLSSVVAHKEVPLTLLTKMILQVSP